MISGGNRDHVGVLHAAHLLELAETELCNMADLDGLERRLSGGMHVLEPLDI